MVQLDLTMTTLYLVPFNRITAHGAESLHSQSKLNLKNLINTNAYTLSITSNASCNVFQNQDLCQEL